MASLAVHAQSLTKSNEPVDKVDLFVGTSNSRWMLGPYATVPYGMVQLGPDNQQAGWMGGYEYSVMNVSGFSHIHAWTMSGLRVMPAMQDFTKTDGACDKPYRGGSAVITHASRKNRRSPRPVITLVISTMPIVKRR